MTCTSCVLLFFAIGHGNVNTASVVVEIFERIIKHIVIKVRAYLKFTAFGISAHKLVSSFIAEI